MELTIDRGKFNNFLRVIKIIENVCTDCDIVSGTVRQKTNSGFCIIEMDLTDVLTKECTVPISLLKQKIGLFKIFENDDSDINKSNKNKDEKNEEEKNDNSEEETKNKNIFYRDDERTYTIGDDTSEITFRKAAKNYLDNKFIDDENIIKKLNSDGLVQMMDYKINSNVSRRIRGVCDGFSVDVINVKVNKGKATFNISTVNNENFSNIVKDVTYNAEDVKYHFPLPAFAFSSEANDVNIQVFMSNDKNILMYKFVQKIFNIPVTITGKTEIRKSK